MAVHEMSESSPERFIGMSEMNGMRSAGELDPSSPIIEGDVMRRTGDGFQHGAEEDVEGVEFGNETSRDGSGSGGGEGDGQMSVANTTEVDEFHGVSEASQFSLLRELHELRVPSPSYRRLFPLPHKRSRESCLYPLPYIPPYPFIQPHLISRFFLFLWHCCSSTAESQR